MLDDDVSTAILKRNWRNISVSFSCCITYCCLRPSLNSNRDIKVYNIKDCTLQGQIDVNRVIIHKMTFVYILP